MVLSHRLAPTFGRDPLQTSARQMRGVRPPSWKNGLPLGRRALVGSREEAVARRTRQTTAAATRAVAVEGDYPVDARGPRLLASRSRPNEQPASNLKAFCQRCHMLHDRPEHQRRRWMTLFRRRALGDLYQGRYQ